MSVMLGAAVFAGAAAKSTTDSATISGNNDLVMTAGNSDSGAVTGKTDPGVASDNTDPVVISADTDPDAISGNEALDSWIRVLAPLEDSLVAGIDGGIDIEDALGPDPFLIAPAPSPSERAWVVLLRRSDEIALLDEHLEITQRLRAPLGPSSWAWIDSSHVVVGGEESASLALYRVGRALEELARIEIATHGIRGMAFDPESRTGFALDPIGDRALAFQVEHDAEPSAEPFAEPSAEPFAQHSRIGSGWRLSRRPELDIALPAGPLHAVFINGSLITNSLLGHTITVHRQTGDGWMADASVTLDGPIWSIDASARGDTIWIAAGGIEDRPLDRTEGEFGNIDSYQYLYRYVAEDIGNEQSGHSQVEAGDRNAPTLTRVAEWNLSELGVVTPKRVVFDDGAIWASGSGGERIVRLPVRERSELATLSLPCPPGISDFVLDRKDERLIAVSPLLDVVAALPLPDRTSSLPTLPERDSPATLAPRLDEPVPYMLTALRSTPMPLGETRRAAIAELELGELLVFTTLLTPGNRSDGELSRFTCEACHFEGGVDGRTHFTGREHVFATTKPIRGLGHNVPFFSRAGSELLCDMVPAEFAVANQGRSDRNWITAENHPWLGSTSLPSQLSPEMQRRGMVRYLFELPVIPHPSRSAEWTLLEQEGLRVFRDRCSNCHLPVRTTRDVASPVPFEEWEEALSSPDSDLIWGAPFLMKTGITPYVSPAGARVPSLRRVAWKRPYFTNGSARTIEEVLDRFRHRRGMGWHETTLEAESLTPGEKAALLALLRRF